MRFQLKLTHKLGGAFAVLLISALALGGMAQYSLHALSVNMEARSKIDGLLANGREAQDAAHDWLVHREQLSMSGTDTEHEPAQLQEYRKSSAQVLAALDALRQQPDSGLHQDTLEAYDTGFRHFASRFDAYRTDFSKGVEMVKGLRNISVEILATSQSLQKAVDRDWRKLLKKYSELRAAVQGAQENSEQDHSGAANELMAVTTEMLRLAEQKAVAAILLNKPLAFQEMAKDFILYKDETSGSGLILEMEALLGIHEKATMGQSLKQFSVLFPTGREGKLFAQISALTQNYFDAFKNYFDLSIKMKRSMDAMWDAQQELAALVASIRNASTQQFREEQKTAATRMGLLSLAAVLVSLLFIVMSIKTVVLPIRSIIDQIGAACSVIASGSQEALQRIRRKGSDELADLARSFNELMDVFAENSRKIVLATERAEQEANAARQALDSLQEAQEKAESARKEGTLEAVCALERIVASLMHTSDDLSTQVSGASSQALELQRRTAESSLSLNEMGASIQAVASSSSVAALNAGEVMTTAHKGAGVVQGAIDAIFQVRTQTDDLKSSLGQLSSQANDINAIMVVINDIADQTNLLALNAAIEAARAGDAGRGFAVVADEVRKLAEKTMQATKDVEQAICAIQSSADTNVQGMIRAEEAVSGSTELAQEAEASLKDIVTLVEESAAQVRNIAAAAEQQSVSSEQITEATSLVSSIAQDMADLMQKSDSATAGLLQLAGELRSLIDGLKSECAEPEAKDERAAGRAGRPGFDGAA